LSLAWIPAIPFVLSPSTPFVLSLSKQRTVLRAGLSKHDGTGRIRSSFDKLRTNGGG
jgi:hypothetical protein